MEATSEQSFGGLHETSHFSLFSIRKAVSWVVEIFIIGFTLFVHFVTHVVQMLRLSTFQVRYLQSLVHVSGISCLTQSFNLLAPTKLQVIFYPSSSSLAPDLLFKISKFLNSCIICRKLLQDLLSYHRSHLKNLSWWRSQSQLCWKYTNLIT